MVRACSNSCSLGRGRGDVMMERQWCELFGLGSLESSQSVMDLLQMVRGTHSKELFYKLYEKIIQWRNYRESFLTLDECPRFVKI